VNPWDFSSQGVAEIDHGGVQWLLDVGGPEFQLVAAAATLVAAVATAGHVHGEVAGSVGRGTVQRTVAVPLVAGCPGRSVSRASTCSARLVGFCEDGAATTSRWAVWALVATRSRYTGGAAGAVRCSLDKSSRSLERWRYKFESPKACRSLEPRRAQPGTTAGVDPEPDPGWAQVQLRSVARQSAEVVVVRTVLAELQQSEEQV